MFKWLKRNKSEASSAPAAHEKVPQLLGLRLGAVIELDPIWLQMVEPQLIFCDAAPRQQVQAVGQVQLDADTTLLRYYTDDDGFFQFLLRGGLQAEHIEDAKLWYFYETLGVAGDDEWQRQLEIGGVSRANYELEGRQFSPVWRGAEGVSPPLAMTEKTLTAASAPTQTDQFAMLYEREINERLLEFVLVSGEETWQGQVPERSVVVSTGVNIQEHDFQVF